VTATKRLLFCVVGAGMLIFVALITVLLTVRKDYPGPMDADGDGKVVLGPSVVHLPLREVLRSHYFDDVGMIFVEFRDAMDETHFLSLDGRLTPAMSWEGEAFSIKTPHSGPSSQVFPIAPSDEALQVLYAALSLEQNLNHFGKRNLDYRFPRYWDVLLRRR
jgi:hypothetical protein